MHMRSNATTIDAYLAGLPTDRREAIKTVREVILKNLPAGYEEAMNWGMICYQVPLEVYPDTYNKQPLMYAALGSQKNYMAVYLTTPYGSPEKLAAFQSAYKATGKKLDMGKSCVRFKKLEDLPVEVIGNEIASMPMETFVTYVKQFFADRAAAKKRAS